MSFLKKLFSVEKSEKTERVWRESRIGIAPFHRILFHEKQSKDWKVGNISTKQFVVNKNYINYFVGMV